MQVNDAVEAAFVARFGEKAGWAHQTLFISELASQVRRKTPRFSKDILENGKMSEILFQLGRHVSNIRGSPAARERFCSAFVFLRFLVVASEHSAGNLTAVMNIH